MSILCIEKHFANEAVINTGSTFTSNIIVFFGNRNHEETGASNKTTGTNNQERKFGEFNNHMNNKGKENRGTSIDVFENNSKDRQQRGNRYLE